MGRDRDWIVVERAENRVMDCEPRDRSMVSKGLNCVIKQDMFGGTDEKKHANDLQGASL